VVVNSSKLHDPLATDLRPVVQNRIKLTQDYCQFWIQSYSQGMILFAGQQDNHFDGRGRVMIMNDPE